MKYEEIQELLQFNDEHENKVFMPNEIFNDLDQTSFKCPSHQHFAYSYIYFVYWQYRYNKHMSKYGLIDSKKIKEILGFNSDTKGLDYITKKNGLLDQMEYTSTVKDIPVAWELDEHNQIQFSMMSEYEDVLSVWNLPRKYSIKYPVKAFYRYPKDEEMQKEYNEGYEDGTYYDISNTHEIPFNVFLYCMDNDQIGITGFYIYSFIKRKNDYYKGEWSISMEQMPNEIRLPRSTLLRYLDVLRKHRVVDAYHNQEYFCLALEERKANSYISNKFDEFTYKALTYQKMKIVTVEEYRKKKEEELAKSFRNKIDVPLEELPY
jgi:hypothetical protein